MSQGKSIFARITAGFVIAGAAAVTTPLHAGDAGAFIGGVLAAKVIGSMERRTQAEETQAYYASRGAQPVRQAAPATPAASAMSPQQKLDQLDKLAAGGYITPEEYKAKKKAILDAM